MDDDGMRVFLSLLKSFTKRFEFFQRLRADLVAWRTVQNQFDEPVL